MIRTDPQQAKQEFDKRRLLRLEQVRQQSKELAESVRNKVRKEKCRQLGQMTQEGKEKYKSWQNRKLLELQNQYLDALDEIGTGHKEAEQLADENEMFEAQKLLNKEVAKTRGKLAETKQQVQKNEENFKKSVPIQQKKLVRDLENTRAALVSSMKPKKTESTRVNKQITKPTELSINIPNNSDLSEASSCESSIKSLPKIPQESRQDSEGFCECSEASEEEVNHKHEKEKVNKRLVESKSGLKVEEEGSNVTEGELTRPVTKAGKPYQEVIEESRKLISQTPQKLTVDTRISDRIKQRRLKVEPCRKDPLELSSDDCICVKRSSRVNTEAAVQTEQAGACCRCSQVPSKPAVILREVALKSAPPKKMVPHYDHPTRFVSEKPVAARAEKIDPSNIQIIEDSTVFEPAPPSRVGEKNAQLRGKRAMEKERVNKDYEEMLKKLPMLQRKEHIAQIGTDKPEYHMSEDRLRERERERQNRLENAYASAIPDLKVVTLPSRKHHVSSNGQPLNGGDKLGKWDTDTRKKTTFSAEEVQEIIKAFTGQKPADRKFKLKQLLRSLKVQKEQLIKEIRALPPDDSIDALIGDLTSLSDAEKPTKSNHHHHNRKRRKEESDTSTEMPHKKRAHKRPSRKQKVLVMQNISTQTTPKVTRDQSATTTTVSSATQVSKPVTEDVKICKETHVPCSCSKQAAFKSQEEVCKILIKLGDDSPEVEVVKSPRKDRTKEKRESSVPAAGKKRPAWGKMESWKEHLSKNSSLSSSSTSYFALPGFSKPGGRVEGETNEFNLRKKPQQTNVGISSFRTQGELLVYVKRLLAMSKNSVDELGVSSSDVQTPSQSVIELDSNNPLAALHNAIKVLAGDVQRAPANTEEEEEEVSSVESRKSSEPAEEHLLNQYAQVTETCSKRIADLAAMIDRIRQEKVQMLESPTPLLLTSPDDDSTKYFQLPPAGDKSTSTASVDEEELNKRLLDIDMALAEKLKKFSEDENKEFLERLQKLVHDDCTQPKMDFVPLLVDIPKLPVLEPPDEKRHPPPSKGLISAKRFNGNISLVPHELSTIVEADSAVSTRMSNPGDLHLSSSSSSKLSSSSSDLKSIEAMLKSIGMEWAIPTLHKTQEALAMTSTSSSSKEQQQSKSEVTLREFLRKAVSSSSLNKSDSGGGAASFVKECSELSEIRNSSGEKTKQRTSTPVMSSGAKSGPQLFAGVSDVSSVRNNENSGEEEGGKDTFHSLGGSGEQSSKSET